MDVLQGHYLKKIKSKSGQLEGLKLETAEGIQTVHLPKSLREIALQELAIGDTVRVWSEIDSKKGKAKTQKRYATALIPLSPKVELVPSRLDAEEAGGKQVKSKKAESKKGKSKKSKSKKSKSKKAKGKLMTVQLCQKKNCCKKGGTTLWEKFEGQQAETENSVVPFKLEAVGCLGGCKRGPNIRFLPKNVKHYHVQPDEVTGLLKKYQA